MRRWLERCVGGFAQAALFGDRSSCLEKYSCTVLAAPDLNRQPRASSVDIFVEIGIYASSPPHIGCTI
jgi:hypothetical protein